MKQEGNSLGVQQSGLLTYTAKGLGSLSGHRTNIPPATWHGQKRQKKNKPRSRERECKRRGYLAPNSRKRQNIDG